MSDDSRRADYLLSDIMGWQMLSPLMHDRPYLPFTGAALRPFCLSHILNDILVNSRKHIIEFGSGVSTLIIARLIKANDLPAKMVSIEHDENWCMRLRRLVKEEGLEEIVNQVHAPLGACHLSKNNCEWYKTESIISAIKSNKFDMIIVDGPPAWKPEIQLSRYPAVPFMLDNLDETFSIFLDDAIRPGEKDIIKMWEKELGLSFVISNQSLAYAVKGHANFTEPFSYY